MWSILRIAASLSLLAMLIACNPRPLTPEEVEAQHRFETGCRGVDAQGYEMNMPYCGHGGSRDH
jgi:hypothetical protein